MADVRGGTATGPQRAELRVLLKRLDSETQEEVLADINPDDPNLSAEDAADGIKLLTQLLERQEREEARLLERQEREEARQERKREKMAQERKEDNPGAGCGCLAALGLLLVLWWFGIVQLSC